MPAGIRRAQWPALLDMGVRKRIEGRCQKTNYRIKTGEITQTESSIKYRVSSSSKLRTLNLIEP